MAHVRKYFEEVQRFRQNRWVWYIFTPFTLLVFLPLLNGIYIQLVKGIPWGDKPMSNDGLIAFILFMLVCWALTGWMLYSIRLEVYIDSEGVHYRYFPNRYTWRTIARGEITSYEVRRKKIISETGGIGYHRNVFRNSRSMIIRGSVYIRLVLSGDRKVLIGTQHPDEFDRALKRLFTNHSNE
ncbi:hypothetical protein [Ohtaekwangia sp.]|uniref:hypothetical protein n=1 Tax=Ohtaekwangia sp. TaxID=2066019 RepID=UPI002F93D289